MTFRDAAIRATERMIDALGEPVPFQSAGGRSGTPTVIFHKEYYDPETGIGTNSAQTAIEAKSSDGPFATGDEFIVEDITYSAVQLEPDADGMTIIRVQKHA